MLSYLEMSPLEEGRLRDFKLSFLCQPSYNTISFANFFSQDQQATLALQEPEVMLAFQVSRDSLAQQDLLAQMDSLALKEHKVSLHQ